MTEMLGLEKVWRDRIEDAKSLDQLRSLATGAVAELCAGIMKARDHEVDCHRLAKTEAMRANAASLDLIAARARVAQLEELLRERSGFKEAHASLSLVLPEAPRGTTLYGLVSRACSVITQQAENLAKANSARGAAEGKEAALADAICKTLREALPAEYAVVGVGGVREVTTVAAATLRDQEDQIRRFRAALDECHITIKGLTGRLKGSRPVAPVSFEAAWAKTGYQYGGDALQNVQLGWKLRETQGFQPYVDIVFDGPPGATPGRFVEAEYPAGTGIKIGEWLERPGGFWALRIPAGLGIGSADPAAEDPDPPRAAVALVEREGRYLCVWNRRYGGWTFPGGKVEASDRSITAACLRELKEETGADGLVLRNVYEGPHGVADDPKDHPGRGRIVHIYEVEARGPEPRESEPGAPVTWLTREEYLRWSPFRDFYVKVFAALDGGR